jgi:membrane protein required for colicin V production
VTIIDWVIVAILLISTFEGLRRGLISAVFSLGGLILGFILAARFWPAFQPILQRFIHEAWVVELVSYLLVILIVVVAMSVLGHLLRRTAHAIGLGWIDRILGGAFGLLRGALLVVLGFIIVAAFYPSASWTRNSRIAPFFLTTAQRAMRSAPTAAASRVVLGAQQLQQQTRSWW